MKRSHIVLLIITALTALLSAYSLAAINQVYKIGFEWYSQYYNKFTNEYRETFQDKWQLEEYPEGMHIGIVGSESELLGMAKEYNIKRADIPEVDYNEYILIYLTLGEVNSLDYRIKVLDLAQRGEAVEVKVDVNSPGKINEDSKDKYFPVDVVRINRNWFPIKGDLRFIFKNQNGIQLYEKIYKIV